MKLTEAHKCWGFGLCFAYLRNVKGFRWNHKRVYRIYRELELNLRIKPRARLKQERPEMLSVPTAPNQVLPEPRKSPITMLYIQPGKPTQNVNIERFNRTARHEWLDMHLFHSVPHARILATQWLWSHNN